MSNLWRWDARRDDNEPLITEALRKAGCSVHHLSGAGIPDLLVGYKGVTLLLEVKNKTGLTKAQKQWYSKWTGQVAVVRSPEQAIQTVQAHYARYRDA